MKRPCFASHRDADAILGFDDLPVTRSAEFSMLVMGSCPLAWAARLVQGEATCVSVAEATMIRGSFDLELPGNIRVRGGSDLVRFYRYVLLVRDDSELLIVQHPTDAMMQRLAVYYSQLKMAGFPLDEQAYHLRVGATSEQAMTELVVLAKLAG